MQFYQFMTRTREAKTQPHRALQRLNWSIKVQSWDGVPAGVKRRWESINILNETEKETLT